MSKKKLPKHFYYLDVGPYPVQVIFAPNKRAFKRVMKKFGVVGDTSCPTSNGCVTFFPAHLCKRVPTTLLVVTVDLSPEKGLTPEQEVGMIAHEAVHVLQYLCVEIGETDPGLEFEAYTIQGLVQSIVSAAKQYRKDRDE